MSRRLKHVCLTEKQEEDLRKGLLNILDGKNFGVEYKSLIKLLKHIGLGDQKKQYVKTLAPTKSYILDDLDIKIKTVKDVY